MCPACGRSSLFETYLGIKSRCESCGADLSVADTADGPAFFVMFAVMIPVVPLAMMSELVLSPPLWFHALIWPPVVFGLCLALLRPFKSLLFAMQWVNDAREVRLGEDETGPH